MYVYIAQMQKINLEGRKTLNTYVLDSPHLASDLLRVQLLVEVRQWHRQLPLEGPQLLQ